ncbi:MAG: right-handed parallel beta-helix repeat-containing protein [Isosphaeraceae bacterium]|nr:right-handed parallel beta-helix repeat-containing protein [Isosphaeraceae bacterium]
MLLRRNERRRAVRAAEPRVEPLEGRVMLADLALHAAEVLPDGRTIQLQFLADPGETPGMPDWLPSHDAGVRLTTEAGTKLEPIGHWSDHQQGRVRWTSTFLINDPAGVVVFGREAPRISAPRGLLADERGNATRSIGAIQPTNRSLVDLNGFTSTRFHPGRGGYRIHVSSSRGDDRRSIREALSPALPLRTLEKALDEAWKHGLDRKGGAVRLLRGDTFTSGAPLKISGLDPAHPFVLEDYWHPGVPGRIDPGTRPRLLIDQRSAARTSTLETTSAGGTPATVDHVVIRRLELAATNWAGDLGNRRGISLLRGGKNWTIDDCVIDDFGTNIVVQGFWGPFQDLTLLRTIITDSRVDNSIVPEHTQGLFVQNTSRILISQCVFDNNGRISADRTGRDLYSHNIYIKEDCGPAVVWGNVIRAGGSYGLELRSGGAVAYNYFARNALAAFVDGVGGSQYKNIVEHSEDITRELPRGFGLQMNSTYASNDLQTIEFNIIRDAIGNDPHAVTIDQVGENRILVARVRHNTLSGAGSVKFFSKSNIPRFASVTIDHNLIDSHADFLFELEPFDRWDFLAANQNALMSSNPERAWVRVGNDPMSLDQWTLRSGGAERDSIRRSPDFLDSTVGVDGFNRETGGVDSEADYVQRLRSRPPGIWRAVDNLLALYLYFARAHRLQTPASYGPGMFDEVGIGSWSVSGEFGPIGPGPSTALRSVSPIARPAAPRAP